MNLIRFALALLFVLRYNMQSPKVFLDEYWVRTVRSLKIEYRPFFIRFAQAWLLVLTLSSCGLGQIELSYVKAKTIVGATAPEVLPGGRILVEDDSKIAVSSVAVIKVASTEKVRLRAQKALREYFELIPLTQSTDDVSKLITSRYLLAGEGSFVIDAMSASWDRTIDVVLGATPIPPIPPTPIPPGPEPTPDVPPDGFDNIGQRIARWSVGLPKRVEVGAIYKKYSVALANDPAILDFSKYVSQAGAERVALLGFDAPLYNEVTEKFNADLKARWPMAKGTLSDYLACVARGYGVK